MATGAFFLRILTDGAILTAIIGPLLVLALAVNPRMALSDYPPDVQAAVPPRTRAEFRLGLVFGLPLLIVGLAMPLYSAWRVSLMNGGAITYTMSFATVFVVWLLPFLFDLIVLDILMFSLWTPPFVVIRGSEGMPGYKDVSFHLIAHSRGLVGLVVVAALVALIPTFLY